MHQQLTFTTRMSPQNDYYFVETKRGTEQHGSECDCVRHPVKRAVMDRLTNTVNLVDARKAWLELHEALATYDPKQIGPALVQEEVAQWLAYSELVHKITHAFRSGSDTSMNENDRLVCIQYVEDYQKRRKNIDRRNAIVTLWCSAHSKVGEMIPLRGRAGFRNCGICALPRTHLPTPQPTMRDELLRQESLQSTESYTSGAVGVDGVGVSNK
jgi:hypothetical protein